MSFDLFLSSPKGTDIASAASIALPTNGNRFDVTGNTGPIATVQTNGRAVGTPFTLRLASTPTLTHDAADLILPDADDYTATAGDVLLGEVVGTDQVRILAILPASILAKQSELPSADAYDVSGGAIGVPDASAKIGIFVAARAFTLPASLTGSQATAEVAATAETVFSVKKNGAEIGTITFAIAGTTGTFAGAGASFAAGDKLTVVAPASPDATLADIAFTLKGTVA